MTLRLATSLAAVALALWGARLPQASAFRPQPAGSRSIVVISDLHMGEGRDPSGAWNPYEDFRWSPEFSAFLDAIERDGQGAVDLILNGDTFELLQSNLGNCSGSAAGLGCTENEALARLQRVLGAHDADMKALGRFARAGSNRVVLVPGDHDAALLFPALARRVVSALAAQPVRVEVASSGYWRSLDAQVYAEHGHQIGFGADRFEHWPLPFVRRSDAQHLERPWGQTISQELFNRYEPRYPIVDNMVVNGIGIKYAVAAENDELGDLAAPLLRYQLFALSWQQFRMELDDGEVRAPTWDVGQVRAQGATFLASALPDDDRLRPLAGKALADGRLAKTMDGLSDAELVALCDYRAAVRRARRRFEPIVTQFLPRGPVISECPRTPDTRGATFDYFWRSRDELFLGHLETIARRLPDQRRPVVFVYGHTHLPDRSQSTANAISGGLLKIPMEGFSPVRGALTPVAINDGAWQRTMTPVQFERMASERGVTERELLASLRPEDLAPCYSFVQIGSVNGAPAPAVRYWRQAAGGEWGLASTCGR